VTTFLSSEPGTPESFKTSQPGDEAKASPTRMKREDGSSAGGLIQEGLGVDKMLRRKCLRMFYITWGRFLLFVRLIKDITHNINSGRRAFKDVQFKSRE